MKWTETTILSEALPRSWTPGRSQADAHHTFIFDSVTFCMGEVVVADRAVLRRSGRLSSNLLELLNISPKNPESFIVKLPGDLHILKQIPCDECHTIYGWDRIFRYWRLFREP
jgi:hypothetical protein